MIQAVGARARVCSVSDYSHVMIQAVGARARVCVVYRISAMYEDFSAIDYLKCTEARSF
jgi:hypothetical protein